MYPHMVQMSEFRKRKPLLVGRNRAKEYKSCHSRHKPCDNPYCDYDLFTWHFLETYEVRPRFESTRGRGKELVWNAVSVWNKSGLMCCKMRLTVVFFFHK